MVDCTSPKMSFHIAIIELVSATIKEEREGRRAGGTKIGCEEEDKKINSERHVEVERRGEGETYERRLV